MKVVLFGEELIEALVGHIKHKYDIDIDNDSITDMLLEYNVREHVFEKYRNGQFKKNEDGLRIIDWHKSKWLKKLVGFDENCEISFHVTK